MRWTLTLAFVLSGCGSIPATTPAMPRDALQVAYEAAVRNASTYEKSNEHLLKAIPPGVDTVRVVTWAGRTDGYGSANGNAVTNTWDDVWVTLEPEVQDLCRQFPAEEKIIRLEQLLGLPPEPRDRTFVSIETTTKSLFRPCPDPDVSAPTCSRDFPADVPATHITWMARQQLLKFRMPLGYPWTQLGYTYNWRPGDSIVGASEYVIRKGSAIRALAKKPTADYCH